MIITYEAVGTSVIEVKSHPGECRKSTVEIVAVKSTNKSAKKLALQFQLKEDIKNLK